MVCRLLYVCCIMTLLWSMETIYAQVSTSVPITITLEAQSVLETTMHPTLDVPTSELDVVTGDKEAFFVSLSSAPAGPVNISLSVIDAPPDADPDDLILGPLSFTPTNYGKTVTVAATSDAKEGKYIIELTAVIGKVKDTKTITVMVERDFEFLSISDIEMRPGDTRRRYVQLRPTRAFKWGAIPVTVSIREDMGDRLRAEPTTLSFTEENYNTPQPITVIAADNAMKGDYTLDVIISRDGYDDISERISIRILPSSCSFSTRIESAELNFGTWIKPEVGTGSATIDAVTGATNGVNMSQVGGSPTLGKYVMTTQGCSLCIFSVSMPRSYFSGPQLTGMNTNHTIRYRVDWMGRNPDGTEVFPRRTVHAFATPSISNPQPGDYTFQLGGEVIDIDSNTPQDDYRGTITISNLCR